jgi:predicted flap endonuclease-1-like 5' DNA nuclease
MNQKKRPLGITLLAIFAGIAAFLAIINTLQMLHLFPITGPFGQFRFFTFDLVGALAWGILAAIYIWVVKMLWTLDAQGWLFLVALTIINLIIAVVSILGASSWQAMIPTILINGLILIYCLLPGTKDAFQVEQMQQQAVPTPPPPPKRVEPVSAPEPESTPLAEEEAIIENVDIRAETAVAQAAIAEEKTTAEASPPPTPTEAVEEAAHASAGESAKLSTHTDFIKGIGPAYSQKLHEAGIDSPKSLLEHGATPQGRQKLEEKTGISHKLLMKLVHAADLYRVKGVGSEYAELLDTAGVNTVLELAQRNPEHLHKALIEVNNEKHHVREVPSLNMVASWVEQAKELPRVISY